MIISRDYLGNIISVQIEYRDTIQDIASVTRFTMAELEQHMQGIIDGSVLIQVEDGEKADGYKEKSK